MYIDNVPVLTSDLVMEIIYNITHSPMFYLLLGFMALDFLTGSVKAFIKGQFSSEVGINGLIRHLLVLVLVVFLKFFGRLFGLEVAIYSMGVAFSINYFTSIVENIEAMGFTFPNWIKNKLKQLQEKSEDEIIIDRDDEIVVRKKKHNNKKGVDR